MAKQARTTRIRSAHGPGRAAVRCALCGFAAFAALLVAAPTPAAELVQIRVGNHPTFTRVVFELDSASGYRVERHAEGEAANTILVTLDAASRARSIESQSPGVESVSVAASGANAVARIVAREAGWPVKEMILTDPPRIVLDLMLPGTDLLAPAPAAAQEKPIQKVAEARPLSPAPAPTPKPQAAPAPLAPKSASKAASKAASKTAAPQAAASHAAPPVAVPEPKLVSEPKPVAGRKPVSEPTPVSPPSPAPVAPPSRPVPAMKTAASTTPVVATESSDSHVGAETPDDVEIEEAVAPMARDPKDGVEAPALIGAPDAADDLAEPSVPAIVAGVQNPARVPATPTPTGESEGLPFDGVLFGSIAAGVLALLLVVFAVMRGRRRDDDPMDFMAMAETGNDAAAADDERIPVGGFVMEFPDEDLPPETFEPATEPSRSEAPPLFSNTSVGPEAAPGIFDEDLEEKEAMSMDNRDLPITHFDPEAPTRLAAGAGAIGGADHSDLARLVQDFERRLAHLEARLDESVEAREQLERQVSAQNEELRVQRAAIARTQRALRSISRSEDEQATEPALREPARPSGDA